MQIGTKLEKSQLKKKKKKQFSLPIIHCFRRFYIYSHIFYNTSQHNAF